ncbi:TPA: hypothetical protein N0F65_001035 [Lagenidium giganteum]|uniref:K Homology domain-containing protein n=1 Tax=Lagenidium giganteum TaxID=4803 RepID=A0AAV2YK49_9STRA|nr:TPA: hypothetical protein N0F65_001035 [Lagenidium giganteum]
MSPAAKAKKSAAGTTPAANAPAKAPAKAPATVSAAVPAPAAAPATPQTLKQLQQRHEQVTKCRAENAAKGKKIDEKLRLAFKNPPKRPNMTVEAITEEMDRLEHRRNTTSMSLNDEKFILRELTLLKERKTQVVEYQQFQEMVDTAKKERNECMTQHKAYDEQLQQLALAIKKMTLAEKLNVAVTEFVTLEVSVPDDRMGAVIGKGSQRMQQIEKECSVVLEVDDANKVMRVSSTAAHARSAKEAIEDITLATTHSIGLHPDAIKMLFSQKSKNLQELEQTLKIKIDINKAEGILSTLASPAKAKQLEKAIKELTDGKVDIPLPAEIVPKLIGKKGETINQLMEDTGCLIDIDKISNIVRLCGLKENVDMAKKFVYEMIEEQSQREREFSVHDTEFFPSPDFADFKFDFFAEFLMSNKSQQLKILRTDASDAKIKVFKSEKKIHVIGNKAQLKAMEEALRERLREFENHHWLVEVHDNYVLSLIIGKKGATIKQIESAGAESKVRVDIQGNKVCVLGDNPSAIEAAKKQIMEIIDQNNRSFFTASQYVIAILMNNKRAKLTEIETESGCKINCPPPPAPGNNTRSASDAQVKITLTGTAEAISKAKELLEALDESHHVRYVPLDDDEVPTVIGKKGETISQLETTSGTKLRVVREEEQMPELEMIGTEEQLTAAQKAVDELLQIKNREILQLDAFATRCLIGKKGERINAMRLEHPDAVLDVFPIRGQVRVKASTEEALKKCVEHVLKTLRESLMTEIVTVPEQNQGGKSANFHTIMQQEALAARLYELEAEGGENMKVTITDDGKSAKIRGPALGIGKLKKFLDMLVSADGHFVETIELPTYAFAGVLLSKGGDKTLNENALRICKQTGCEIRVKKGTSDGGVIVIEGSTPVKVFEAKESVEKVIQFYYGENFHVMENLPQALIPRLYELLPLLAAKHRVVFSLASKSSLKIMTDSKATTKEIVKQLQNENQAWKQQHVEVPVEAWLVPLFVGKSGEAIKKLSAECNGARLDLSPHVSKDEDRVLTISARDDETVKHAVKKVKEVLEHHRNKSSTFDVSKDKLELVLKVKKETPSGIQFHILFTSDDQRQVVIYGGEHEAREALVEKMQHLIDTSTVETIVLPSTVSPGVASSVIGALIGKSGANIKALQNEFQQVKVDIQRGTNTIYIAGPNDEVLQVKHIMQDKVDELLQQEEERQQYRGQARAGAAAAEEAEKPKRGPKDAAPPAENRADADENTTPNRAPSPAFPTLPVGASAAMAAATLTKNQRRRMRKRAQNEQNSDVLSMIMGSSASPTAGPTTGEADNSGYYHSSSGYSLRL